MISPIGQDAGNTYLACFVCVVACMCACRCVPWSCFHLHSTRKQLPFLTVHICTLFQYSAKAKVRPWLASTVSSRVMVEWLGSSPRQQSSTTIATKRLSGWSAFTMCSGELLCGVYKCRHTHYFVLSVCTCYRLFLARLKSSDLEVPWMGKNTFWGLFEKSWFGGSLDAKLKVPFA